MNKRCACLLGATERQSNSDGGGSKPGDLAFAGGRDLVLVRFLPQFMSLQVCMFGHVGLQLVDIVFCSMTENRHTCICVYAMLQHSSAKSRVRSSFFSNRRRLTGKRYLARVKVLPRQNYSPREVW